MVDEAQLYPDNSLGLGATAYAIPPAGVRIGRHSENDINLPVESVSRHHARLQYAEKHGWTLTDLGSSNGTFINGERIKGSAAIADGDRLTFGKADLRFHCTPLPGRAPSPGVDPAEQSSGIRVVGEEESGSIILSTQSSDKTPFATVATPLPDPRFDHLNRRLVALYRLSDILRGATRRDEIVQALLEVIFESLPADRGVVLKIAHEADDLVPELYYFAEGITERELILSRTIINRAISERVAVLSRDVRVDPTLASSQSLMASDTRSAMCVPLSGKRQLMGLLFLDTREAVRHFSEDDLAFVSALATDAAMTLENLALLEENVRQERLAAVGQTISGLAHNIKNILQLARGGTELMDHAIAKQNIEEIKALWPINRRSLERMQALTQEMLDFSRHTRPRLTPVKINDVVTHLAEMVEGEATRKNIQFHTHLDATCDTVMASEDDLNKALYNLVTNAFDALTGRPDAQVEIITECVRGTPQIRVKDNGPGIPAEILNQVFQPFFSTKGSKGNGLGLSMSRKYLEDMGAQLDVESNPDDGCEFIIQFGQPTQPD